MKTDPKYGYYPWWPEDGDDWIHPEDAELARTLIPSPRVFCRDGEQEPYVLLHYGDVLLRVKRTLWQAVEPEGFGIGDWVEVLSRGMRNTPRTAVIHEMHWDAKDRQLVYQVTENGVPVPNQYAGEDLKHVDPPKIEG